MIVTYEDAKKAATAIRKAVDPFLHLISREGRMLFMKDIAEEWVKQAGDAILLKQVCCPWDRRHGKKRKNQ